jgi:hypothetical protein
MKTTLKMFGNKLLNPNADKILVIPDKTYISDKRYSYVDIYKLFSQRQRFCR